ncbi:hypothetical protein F5887DRAFT_982993, partial [Amanita rubescens]
LSSNSLSSAKSTYPLSLYSTYVTIGYGEVIPRPRAGRPGFSLAGIPAMTLLNSVIGDTLATWVREGPAESIIYKWLMGT